MYPVLTGPTVYACRLHFSIHSFAHSLLHLPVPTLSGFPLLSALFLFLFLYLCSEIFPTIILILPCTIYLTFFSPAI